MITLPKRADPGAEHKPTEEEFLAVVNAMIGTANEHTCCSQHAAHAAVVVAVTALQAEYGQMPDTIDKALRYWSNVTMNAVRSGSLKFVPADEPSRPPSGTEH